MYGTWRGDVSRAATLCPVVSHPVAWVGGGAWWGGAPRAVPSLRGVGCDLGISSRRASRLTPRWVALCRVAPRRGASCGVPSCGGVGGGSRGFSSRGVASHPSWGGLGWHPASQRVAPRRPATSSRVPSSRTRRFAPVGRPSWRVGRGPSCRGPSCRGPSRRGASGRLCLSWDRGVSIMQGVCLCRPCRVGVDRRS